MSEEALNLFQKLAKIRAISDAAQKSKRGYNYTYTDITEILANVTAGMTKYGVSLVPTMVPGTSVVEKNVVENVKYSKDGKRLETTSTEMLFRTDMIYIWVNDEDPNERIEVPWFAAASMGDAAQSIGSAMTYTLRQFLTAYFQIAQNDDVDAYRSRQKEAEESESRGIADGITDQILTMINTYLESHPDDRNAIIAIVKKYAKDRGKASPNPKVIRDPEVAARLLSEIRDKCAPAS